MKIWIPACMVTSFNGAVLVQPQAAGFSTRQKAEYEMSKMNAKARQLIPDHGPALEFFGIREVLFVLQEVEDKQSLIHVADQIPDQVPASLFGKANGHG